MKSRDLHFIARRINTARYVCACCTVYFYVRIRTYVRTYWLSFTVLYVWIRVIMLLLRHRFTVVAALPPAATGVFSLFCGWLFGCLSQELITTISNVEIKTDGALVHFSLSHRHRSFTRMRMQTSPHLLSGDSESYLLMITVVWIQVPVGCKYTSRVSTCWSSCLYEVMLLRTHVEWS